MPKGNSGKGGSSGGNILKANITIGSEKQIALAKNIQNDFYKNIQNEKANLTTALEKQFSSGAALQGNITKKDVMLAVDETASRIANETISFKDARTYINDDTTLRVKTMSKNFGNVFREIISTKIKK